MKLELKHLAPYLPYGLKIEHPTMLVGKRKISELRNLGQTNIEVSHRLYVQISNCKLILLPISEFGDKDNLREVHEFIGLGNWCEHYDNYFDAWFNDACSIKKLVLQAPQEIFNYFLANHFDVFGLIPAGLAISIHNVGQVVA